MEIVLQRRAEIAIRSLSKFEQKQIKRALDTISSVTPTELYQNPKFRKLRVGSGETLYMYRGNLKLRLLLTIQGENCTIEDVVDRDKLSHLPLNLDINEESKNSLV
jgi:mRNA-degrading endonuclease RelE of RelBE toxin-antitoxin system